MKELYSASEKARNARLLKKYGVTIWTYGDLLSKQKGLCAICLRTPKTKRLCVDHDHKTGQVRGLLCYVCNRKLIGRYRYHQAWIFERAWKYLLATPPPKGAW